MSETTPLIKAALNLRVGAGFDVYDVVKMPAGCCHTVIAETELKLIEVQIGKDISVQDKEKVER